MKGLMLALRVGFLTLLIGCVSTKDRLVNVHRGMDAKEVQAILGSPEDRTFKGRQELWSYRNADEKGTKLVVFEDGKVVELLNAGEADQFMHAARTKDVQSAENRVFHCALSNKFGKFAEGAGCNMYGCWPPGGHCNGFGCTASGFCTVRGCPSKITSYQCQD